jgi:hypothetical protein
VSLGTPGGPIAPRSTSDARKENPSTATPVSPRNIASGEKTNSSVLPTGGIALPAPPAPATPAAMPSPVVAPPPGAAWGDSVATRADDRSQPTTLDGELLAQFNMFVEEVRHKLDQGRLDEGLVELSRVYQIPELPPTQCLQLAELLGQVAGTVIYSRQHLLEPPYRVRPGETLGQIAHRYQVPPEVLARINGIRDPVSLQPGQELKVLRGPFSAVVSLERKELVLFLQGRYAGRFPIGIGGDQPRLEGNYTVRDKIVGPFYVRPDGVTITANDPANPLGKYKLDLGGGVAIHGTNNPQAIGRTDNPGAISLAERDIEDVFTILSIGSEVVIRR